MVRRLVFALFLFAAIANAQPSRSPLTRGLADALYAKLAGGSTIAGTTTFSTIVVTTCTGCTSGAVPTTRLVSTTSPLGGGGDLSADRTLTCTLCLTSGGALGTPSSGTGTNLTGIPESGVTNLTTDLATKALSARLISTTSPLGGGGDLSSDRTLTCTGCLVSGGALGTPASGVGTNFTGIPESGVTNLTSDLALKAPLASPPLTGTPTAPTAAVDTNTTQLATTAMVVAQAASATPLANGSAAVGTSLRYARGDHVHATDTTLAPKASPIVTTLDVSDGNIQIKEAQLQSFILVFTNTAGTIQHAIRAQGGDATTAATYSTKVTGASPTLANTPFVTNAVNFTNGVGVDNASKSDIYLNTANAQVVADVNGIANIMYDDTAVALSEPPMVSVRAVSLNINGTTRLWPVLSLTVSQSTPGSGFTIDTTNIPSGKTIIIRVYAWFK